MLSNIQGWWSSSRSKTTFFNALFYNCCHLYVFFANFDSPVHSKKVWIFSNPLYLKIFEWLSIFSFTACIQSNKNPIANNDSSENYKSTFWHFAVHTTHTITGATFICTILSTEWLSIPKFEYTYYHSSIHSPFYISDKLLFCSMFYL